MDNIIENNKLIAEFMGLTVTDSFQDYSSEIHTNLTKDLRYHESWDWLMPVVEKIKNDKSLYQNYLNIMVSWEHRLKEAMFQSLVRLYKEVVEFINWYNNQQNQ